MNKRKLVISGLITCVAVLVMLVFALHYLTPRLINSESIKTIIEGHISEKTGGTAEFQSVDLSILPLPHVIIHKGAITIPETASGSMESMSVYPKVFPLFKGKFHFSEIRITSPDVEIILPKRRVDKNEKERPPVNFLASANKQMASLLATLALNAPGLAVEIEEGRINLFKENKGVFLFEDINARIVFPPEGLEANIRCSSSIWQDLILKARIDPEGLMGKGYIDLEHFKPDQFLDFFFPEVDQYGSGAMERMRIGFETDGFRNVQAEVRGSGLTFVYQHLKNRTDIKAKKLRATLDMDGNKTNIAVRELQLDSPRLNISGEFSLDKRAQQVRLALKGKDVDVHSVRETARTLSGDDSVIHTIFNILRDGSVPEITFSADGKSVEDLSKTDNFTITGRLEEGNIFVPGVDLDIKEVKGNVAISKGILKGDHLEGRLDNERGRDGTLTVGLKGKDVPFHLDLYIKTDLGQLTPLLRRTVHNEAFINEIAAIHNVKGSAEGRLILGESLDSVKARVDISRINLSADYQRIPYALKIRNGQIHYDGSAVGVVNLGGNVGKSSFSALNVTVELEREPYFDIQAGMSSIHLEEIFTWLSSYEKLRTGLKEVKTLSGTIRLSELNLKGPILKPDDWLFEGRGDFKAINMSTTFAPAPVEVTQGKFSINNELLSLTNNKMSAVDTSFIVSGTVDHYLDGLNITDLTFSGKMGPEGTEWLSEVINLPRQLRIRSPLSVSQARLKWERDVRTSFQGHFTVRKSPDITVRISHESEELAIHNLTVKDNESDASLALTLKDQELIFNFDGDLKQNTIKNIFIGIPFENEWLRGNFKAHVLARDPEKSSAEGKLEGRNLIFPLKLKVPMTVNSFTLDALNKQVKVKSDITLEDIRFAAKGNVHFLPESFFVDMDISSGGFGWNTIRKTFTSAQDDEKGSAFWDVPVRGALSIQSESFSYDRFTWKPVRANVAFSRNEIEVTVTDASLCGITFPGSLKATPGNLSLDYQPAAERQEFQPAIACLLNVDRYLTGTYHLESKFSTEGKRQELASSLNGTINITAQNGRVYQYGLLSKIFAFLNVTEILRGRPPDFVGEGFPYNRITAKADLQGSILSLNEIFVDGASMKIVSQGSANITDKTVDLKVLIAPLKTVDFIVGKIPLVNRITGGTLISIPLKVTGSFENPDISYVPAKSVGSGLSRIMREAAKAPVEIVEPDIPGGGK
jgi:hypothetical protein